MDVTAVGLPPTVRTVSIDRGDQTNCIDEALIAALHRELDAAEADHGCRVLLVTAAPGVFSTGMNLTAVGNEATAAEAGAAGGAFFDLLTRFTRTPLMIVSAVDGQVAGGGVGLVSASDLVVATDRSTFALPEALWGLLPCCVLPFLVRRTGFQQAYLMALTTTPIDATRAAACGLVDGISHQVTAFARRLALRAARLDTSTIGDLKRYANDLWPVSAATRRLAVGELSRLMAVPAVRRRLADFARDGRYPWES